MFLLFKRFSHLITDNRLVKLESRIPNLSSIRTGILAIKKGMMTHYDKNGIRHPVTVLHIDNCQILRSFQAGKGDNGRLMQEIGIGKKSPRQLHQAQWNYYKSIEMAPKRIKRAFPITSDGLIPPGTFVYASHFLPGQYVDIKSVSIGKGFQGAMKRWGFKGMPASHGCSRSHRALGATGSRTNASKVWKGKKMAGKMGAKNVTVRSLQVLKIDNGLNCLLVRGSVPGPDNQIVRINDNWRKMPQGAPFPTFIHDPKKPLPRYLTHDI